MNDSSHFTLSTPRPLPSGGRIYDYEFVSAQWKPGTHRKGTIVLPKIAEQVSSVGVQFTYDGLRDCEVEVMEKLLAEGAVPPLLSIGVCAAEYPASLPGGTTRSVRSPEYDGLGPSLPCLLIEELLPAVEQALGICLSRDPSMHAITGCSSGGIAAWNACWERNDFFQRCYINSPTFSSFRGGDSFPFLIRKYETKPIRCYITAGTNDMRNSAGDWFLEAESAKEALQYAGYEFEYECFENGPHGAGNHDPAVYERALRFIWKEWSTRPVSVHHRPPLVELLFTADSSWQRLDDDEEMPSPPPCAGYSFERTQLFRTNASGSRSCVATLPQPISAIALSSDLWRLYVAVPSKRFVYAFAIQPDGSLVDPYPHVHLHVKDDFTLPGALGLAVDEGDRVYAATELGIQTTSQQGENNCILALPGNPVVTAVAFHDGLLYAQTAEGAILRRPILVKGANGLAPTAPNTPPF